jgi:hypothetical protein
VIEHYSLSGSFRLEHGLLTAAQVLDLNADAQGVVWAKFFREDNYQPYDKEHWKTHSRFKRGAGEEGCNMLVRGIADPTRNFFLGNNFPLGDGTSLGTKLPLSDNRFGDAQPTGEDWFQILNRMFRVFLADKVNEGVLNHLRAADGIGSLCRITINSQALSDDFNEKRIRLSAINGGGSNGARPRGTATYKAPSNGQLGLDRGRSASGWNCAGRVC